MDSAQIELFTTLLDSLTNVSNSKHRATAESLRSMVEPLLGELKELKDRDRIQAAGAFEGFHPVDAVSQALETLEVPVKYQSQAQNELDRLERETEDILHALELQEMSQEEVLSLGLRLVELRKDRRKLKSFLGLIEPLASLVTKNQPFITNLSHVYADMKMTQRVILNRKYTPRVREDLFEPKPVLETPAKLEVVPEPEVKPVEEPSVTPINPEPTVAKVSVTPEPPAPPKNLATDKDLARLSARFKTS